MKALLKADVVRSGIEVGENKRVGAKVLGVCFKGLARSSVAAAAGGCGKTLPPSPSPSFDFISQRNVAISLRS